MIVIGCYWFITIVLANNNRDIANTPTPYSTVTIAVDAAISAVAAGIPPRRRLNHSSIDGSAKLSQLNDWFSEERCGVNGSVGPWRSAEFGQPRLSLISSLLCKFINNYMVNIVWRIGWLTYGYGC